MNMRTTTALLFTLALGLPALAPTPVAAQTARQGPPTEARQRLERQVRERFETLIREELGIDEATSTALRETMESFMGERRDLAMRQAELRRRLGSSGTLLDEAGAREVLDEVVAVQRAEVDLLAREQEALLGILSPPQLVRFYTLRERFGERVRTLRGGPAGTRRGGGGPGGGPGAEWPGPFLY